MRFIVVFKLFFIEPIKKWLVYTLLITKLFYSEKQEKQAPAYCGVGEGELYR